MVKVADVYQRITLEPCLIDRNESLDNVLEKFRQINPVHSSLYVVDENRKLTGLITMREILQIHAIRKGVARLDKYSKTTLLNYLLTDSTAERIARPDVSVKADDNVHHAIRLIIREELYELPVVDDDKTVIGDLNAHELLRGKILA